MGYEDFTTYTEVDPNSHISLTSTNINHIAWLNEDAYVYYDYGVAAFGDLYHEIEAMYVNNFGGSGYRKSFFWGLTNEVNDGKYFFDNDKDCIFASYTRRTNGTEMFHLQAQDGSTYYDDYYESPDLDVWYYFTIERNGSTATLKIYSDSARTVLVDTLTITCPTTKFRYIYACNTWNRAYSVYQTVYIRNLNLFLPVPKKLVLKLGDTMGIALEDISKKDTVIMV